MAEQKVLLMILDGWGLAPAPQHSAIAQARTPFIDHLYQQYPHSQLAASGLAVGLPVGQMGNSEVGHMTLGAGRTTDQSLVRINKAIASGAFFDNPTLLTAFAYAKTHQKTVHLLGLVSDGGVHAHIDHLKAICTAAHRQGLHQLLVHAFTDGRDAGPYSAIDFLAELEGHLRATTGQLASVMGRYYAMDRDHRWERTRVAYEALVRGQGQQAAHWRVAIEEAYAAGISDEFLRPIMLTDARGEPRGTIREGDVVLCFNFRTDRSRQLTEVLTQPGAWLGGGGSLGLHYCTMTVYDERLRGVRALFAQEQLRNTLGEVLSLHGKRQLRIAETEKYPHVTYFFSGGREAPFAGEERIICPSPQVATYDLAPAMGAPAITKAVLPVLAQQNVDFVCLNFANADMVGHTGVFEATVRACEVVDQCTAQVVQAALAQGYAVVVVADHGNADTMRDAHGLPHTAHSLCPVPCIWVGPRLQSRLRNGTLADVAPTILQAMGLPIPATMQGSSLR